MATTAQRTFIRNLLKEAEYALDRVSLLHTRIPHCERRHVDMPIDTWIDSLSKHQASEVIGMLQEAVA